MDTLFEFKSDADLLEAIQDEKGFSQDIDEAVDNTIRLASEIRLTVTNPDVSVKELNKLMAKVEISLEKLKLIYGNSWHVAVAKQNELSQLKQDYIKYMLSEVNSGVL